MKRRDHQTRLHLIVTAGIQTPRQRRKPKQKKHKQNTRAMLLNAIRVQRQRIGGNWFSRAEAPELHDLAIAADAAPYGKRFITFQGVRFPLKFGFRRYVCDPKTGEILIGGRFLA